MSTAKDGSDKSAPQTSNKTSSVAAEEAEGSFQCGECMGKITLRTRTRQSSSVMKKRNARFVRKCNRCMKTVLNPFLKKLQFQRSGLYVFFPATSFDIISHS